jgi:hypothetical protein
VNSRPIPLLAVFTTLVYALPLIFRNTLLHTDLASIKVIVSERIAPNKAAINVKIPRVVLKGQGDGERGLS